MCLRAAGQARLVMRIPLILMLVVCPTLALAWSGARDKSAFYAVQQPLANQSEAARTEAVRQGLAHVLERLTGLTQLPKSPSLAEAFRQPDRFYTRLRFTADEEIRIDFDPASLLRLIDSARLPLWPLRRPRVIAWLVAETGANRTWLLRTHPLAEALLARATDMGLTLVLPLMDLEDQVRVQPGVVWGGSTLILERASRRYDAEAVLVGRIQAAGPVWFSDVSVQFSESAFPGTSEERRFTAVHSAPNLADLGILVADRLVAQVAARQSLPWRGAEVQSLRIEGVSTPDRYGQLLRYLNGLEYLAGYDLLSVEQDQIVVEVRSRAAPDRLAALLRADDALLALPSEMPGAWLLRAEEEFLP